MHEYSSISSSASDITMASTRVSSSSNWNLSISSSSEEEDAVPSSATACQEALAEVAGRPRECPVGLDDQLVEDRVGLKNGAETCLYEPNDSLWH